jgi:hypothetical protein
MGPFLGPFAAAFLAALAAGLTLGILRLSRRSLEWWKRRVRPAVLPGALEAMADAPAFVPLPDFPGVHGAIACAAAAALLVGFVAFLAPGPFGPPPVIAQHPFTPTALAPRALTHFAFGFAALATTLALALLASLLERGLRATIARVSARVRQLRALHVEDLDESPLSMADLKAGAALLLSGTARGNEPFGVGLSYVALFVTPVAATALVARAALGPAPPGWIPLFATAFLAVPAAYAAAAERSQRDAGARQRRRAALRQLVAAPAWALALIALTLPGTVPHVAGWLALACAALIALPGSTEGTGLLEVPSGGDEAEPSPSVRAISGLAHHGWIGAWAGFMSFHAAPVVGAGPLVGGAMLALAGLLLLRALVIGLARERAGAWLLGLAWGLALLDLLLHSSPS